MKWGTYIYANIYPPRNVAISPNLPTSILLPSFRHWLGLGHTFDNGCSPGDLIPDTPPEAIPNHGCNPSEMRDTCPEPGVDPIHNFLDYSDDRCVYEFTIGQIHVMHANIEFYRSQSTPDLLEVNLTNDTFSQNFTMAPEFTRQFYLDVPIENASVVCMTTADNGDIDLLMNWDGTLDQFECKSETSSSQEMCTMGPGSGTAYATVYSRGTTIDFQVRCTILNGPIPILVVVTEGLPVPISMERSSVINATLACPDPFSVVTCSTFGTGDVDMTMSFSAQNPKCSSLTGGSSNETCHAGPGGGTVYIVIAAWESSQIDLQCVIRRPILLESGVTSEPYVVNGQEYAFYVDVAAAPSTVACQVIGHRAGVSLSMSWNDLAVTCVSGSETSNTTCSLGLGSGIAYAVVNGYAPDYSFVITCTVSERLSLELNSGKASDLYYVSAGENMYFSLNVSALSTVTCATDGIANDAVTLSMSWNDPLKQGCISANIESTTICFLPRNMGMVYVRAHATDSSSMIGGFSILCTAQRVLPLRMESGAITGPYNVHLATTRSFVLPVVDSLCPVTCTIQHRGSGMMGACMSWSDSPVLHCAPSAMWVPSSSVEYTLPPGSGEAHVWLYGQSATSDVMLNCTSTALPVVELMDNVASGPFYVAMGERMYFSLSVPTTDVPRVVTCETSADNGDLDLSMKWDGSSQDICTSDSFSSIESCTMEIAGFGTAYATITAVLATENFYITCRVN